MEMDQVEYADFPINYANASYQIVVYPASELPAAYISLVFAKWLRSLRFGNPLFKKIDSDAFYKEYHGYLEALLKKPNSVIRLAVLSDDSDVVLGFSVSRESILDYVYVHKDQRKVGIAKILVPKGITTITHITDTALKICEKQLKDRSLLFNPFA
jgi:hypothetical protein